MRRNNLPAGRGGPLVRVNFELGSKTWISLWICDVHRSTIFFLLIDEPIDRPLNHFESNFSKKGSSRDNFPGSWAPDSNREASQHAAGNVVHPAACISFVISVEPHTHSANSYLRALTTYLAACYAIRDAYIYILHCYKIYTVTNEFSLDTPSFQAPLGQINRRNVTRHVWSLYCTVLYRIDSPDRLRFTWEDLRRVNTS